MTEPARRLGFGSFTLDPAERLLLKDGRVVPLTPKAFDLLAVMVRNPGRLLNKDELIKEVWPDAFVEESNLAYNVFTIRKALGEGSDTDRYIDRQGIRPLARIAAPGTRQPSHRSRNLQPGRLISGRCWTAISDPLPIGLAMPGSPGPWRRRH